MTKFGAMPKLLRSASNEKVDCVVLSILLALLLVPPKRALRLVLKIPWYFRIHLFLFIGSEMRNVRQTGVTSDKYVAAYFYDSGDPIFFESKA